MAKQQQVKVGDLMRFSTALLDRIHEKPQHLSELVQVLEVRQERDGSKTLVLQRYSPQLPCECGCGAIVEGGFVEFAHPEDYRYERG